MRTVLRRIAKLEQVVGASTRAEAIPDPFDTLSPEDQALCREYWAARDSGAYRHDRPDFHKAQHRYLAACCEYDRQLRAAGVEVPLMTMSEVLQRRRELRIQRGVTVEVKNTQRPPSRAEKAEGSNENSTQPHRQA